MEARIVWELVTAMSRLNMRWKPPRREPKRRYTAAHRAMTRTGKAGGIDAIHYRREVLIPKLIPFTKRCKLTHPYTLVQEGNAPSHASRFQQELVYNIYDIIRLLWPGKLIRPRYD